MRRAALTLVMVCLSTAVMANDGADLPCAAGSRRMARTELYFGAGRSSAREWHRFLAHVVTPRFPEGLTTFDGTGQWRSPGGPGISEATHILVLFYRPDAESDARLEAIRTIYKRRFRQLSVLRADTQACVGF